MVNGGVNHDGAHPTHKQHLQVLFIGSHKFAKAAEDLYKAVVYNINGCFVPVYITKHHLQAIAEVMLIKGSLLLWLIGNTALYYDGQIFQCSGCYLYIRKWRNKVASFLNLKNSCKKEGDSRIGKAVSKHPVEGALPVFATSIKLSLFTWHLRQY